MKRLWNIMLWLCAAATLYAQDLQRLSDRELIGTARYVGLCGAMTAIGGDPSAVMDNPAGLGVYQRMEVSATLDVRSDRYRDVRNNELCPERGTHATISQAAWVLAFAQPSKQTGVIASNIMVSYRRLRSFHSNYTIRSDRSQTTLSQLIADKTNPNQDGSLHAKYLSADNCWDDESIGWLSILGYENYQINPIVPDSVVYSPALSEGGVQQHSLHIEESGSVNDFGVSWGLNISHRWYVGLAANMQSIAYSKYSTYSERSLTDQRMTNEASLWFDGLGVDFKVGMILRPLRSLRLGASIQTPSFLSLRVQNRGTMSARGFASTGTKMETPTNATQLQDMRLPMRLSLSAASQIFDGGLLAVQYDYQHYKDRMDVHQIRLGGELAMAERFYMEAGYAFESTFRRNVKPEAMMYNTVRTDTDFENVLMGQYAAAGLGYRGSWGTAHLAYQCRWREMEIYAHEKALPYELRGVSHRVVLTLNWHTK